MSDAYRDAVHDATVTYVAEASTEMVVEPKVVLIEVERNWDEQQIESYIREVFYETPNTAVAVATCESQLNPKAIGPTDDYSIFQVHAPTWHDTAIELGYKNYQTDPKENIDMARYIYDEAGQKWSPWYCYNFGWWKKYL